MRFVGKLECADVESSWRYYEEAGNGGFVDGNGATCAVDGVKVATDEAVLVEEGCWEV